MCQCVFKNTPSKVPSFNPFGSCAVHIAVLKDEKNIAAYSQALLKSDGHLVVVLSSGKSLLKTFGKSDL
jgi:hypothetical protein